MKERKLSTFLTKEELFKKWGHYLDEEALVAVLSRVEDDLKNGHKICPRPEDVFNAFHGIEPDRVRVVILGQDPYPDESHADGLAFSTKNLTKIPSSLRNIFKEIDRDVYFGSTIDHPPNLKRWVRQDVLLLNSFLTCEQRLAYSHREYGWKEVTGEIIKRLSEKQEGIVFLLWGNAAQEKKELIDQNKHYVLSTSHPSPLSVKKGFDGCSHFSVANTILMTDGREPIDW